MEFNEKLTGRELLSEAANKFLFLNCFNDIQRALNSAREAAEIKPTAENNALVCELEYFYQNNKAYYDKAKEVNATIPDLIAPQHQATTPKLLAEELIGKFKPYVNCYSGSGMLTNTEDEETMERFAIKCAMISVEDTLKNIPMYIGNLNAKWSLYTDTKALLEIMHNKVGNQITIK